MTNPNQPSMQQMTIPMLQQLCRQRIDFLATAVLGYKVTPFHARMLKHQMDTTTSMVLAPRGGGKSLMCDVTYIIWRLINNPNLRICIASKSGGQAETFLGLIRSHMTENEDFVKIFGNLQGPLWNRDEITIATRTQILKEPTVTGLGAGEGIVGRHFDIIIGDDLVDLDNSKTKYMRDFMFDWFFNVLEPTLEPGGEFRIIGTRYHEDDLYGRFAKKDKKTGKYANSMFGPHVLCIPALTMVKDEDGKYVLDPETGKPMEESFWPEYFTVEILQNKRANAGLRNFNLQYQNDATIVGGSIMAIEDLEPYVYTHVYDGFGDPPNSDYCPNPNNLAIFIGVDPAISKKEEADFFAIAVIGVTSDAHVYVLEMFKDKLSFRQQVMKLIELNQKYQPIKIGVEAVAYQAALAGELAEYPFMPIEPLKTRLDKILRANAFSAWVTQHKIHCHSSQISLMETLAGMPNVEHDDEFDALEFAVQVARMVIQFDSVVQMIPSNFFGRR